jgi:hypothetical protein
MSLYLDYMTLQSERNPNLCKFLNDLSFYRNQCRVVSLDFISGAESSKYRKVDSSRLRSLIRNTI